MDNLENQEFRPEQENMDHHEVPRCTAQEPAPQEPVQQPYEPPVQQHYEPPVQQNYTAPVQPRQDNYAYRGTGSGRKESPYADSPYVMNHQSRPNYYYQPQQPQSGGRYQTQYEAPKKPKANKKGGIWKKIVAAVAAVALVAGSCGITAALVNGYWEERTDQLEDRFQQQLEGLQAQIDAQAPGATGNSVSGTLASEDGYSAGQVYAQNVHSVVLIECTITTNVYGQSATGMSAGSGFVLSEDGYVVTNYHVVQGASKVEFVLYDGTRYGAEVVGYDDTNDVAVLKADASGLDPVTLGSSDDLIVGDQVVAIGNPLGELTSTLTVGYVSAKERDVTTDGTVINMLQTDAAINSGNSGGPLFNMKGEVVGITTAKYSGASSSGASIEGIGFAIPIDDVMEGIDELIEFGYIKSAYMGVVVQEMDATTAEIYSLPLGVQVISVEEGGAAERAGIQPKDIILAVDDARIEGLTDLTRALRNYEPGDKAWIRVYRGGQDVNVLVTLDERPRNVEADVPQSENQPQMPEGNYDDWFEYFAPFFGYGNGNGG